MVSQLAGSVGADRGAAAAPAGRARPLARLLAAAAGVRRHRRRSSPSRSRGAGTGPSRPRGRHRGRCCAAAAGARSTLARAPRLGSARGRLRPGRRGRLAALVALAPAHGDRHSARPLVALARFCEAVLGPLPPVAARQPVRAHGRAGLRRVVAGGSSWWRVAPDAAGPRPGPVAGGARRLVAVARTCFPRCTPATSTAGSGRQRMQWFRSGAVARRRGRPGRLDRCDLLVDWPTRSPLVRRSLTSLRRSPSPCAARAALARHADRILVHLSPSPASPAWWRPSTWWWCAASARPLRRRPTATAGAVDARRRGRRPPLRAGPPAARPLWQPSRLRRAGGARRGAAHVRQPADPGHPHGRAAAPGGRVTAQDHGPERGGLTGPATSSTAVSVPDIAHARSS